MKAQPNLDQLYKSLFVKMVVALVKKFNLQDIAIAEDVVQETFLAAHQQWKNNPPEHPEAWLFKVCKNIALKNLAKSKAFADVSDEITEDLSFDLDNNKSDEGLRMLTACANARFSPKQQVMFALRYAIGFKVNQIATFLGATPETVTKTLQRLRTIIKEEKIDLFTVQQSSNVVRESLLKIIYLMFNEGYKTSNGPSLLNTELCEDALSLIQAMLLEQDLNHSDTKALYSLMLFNLSRFEARFSYEGNIIDLETQDRNRWDQDMIRVAIHYLKEANTKHLSSYHIEAAIAYLHCTSPSFGATDWIKIVNLYEKLIHINESPFVQLNLAIAKFYAGKYSEALAIMRDLGKMALINHYYLFHVAMGKMLCKVNDHVQSIVHYKKALVLASHLSEKKYIQNLLELVPLNQDEHRF